MAFVFLSSREIPFPSLPDESSDVPKGYFHVPTKRQHEKFISATDEHEFEEPVDRVKREDLRKLTVSKERYKKCSGRDDLCNSVLNDEWASHPTWASEDSGFIAHRKNTYEEQLHKIEEERHDYSLNIESAARAIQLLEPIVQQIAVMTDDERASFLLPPHFGGQTGTTIFERVVKKVYGREIGLQVIQEMQMRPCGIVPIVLSRIKMKEEEWKAAQVCS